jgi:hypothetical protein
VKAIPIKYSRLQALHQPAYGDSVAEQTEEEGDHVGIEAAAISFAVEKERPLALQDVAGHQQEDCLVRVKRHSSYGQKIESQRRCCDESAHQCNGVPGEGLEQALAA